MQSGTKKASRSLRAGDPDQIACFDTGHTGRSTVELLHVAEFLRWNDWPLEADGLSTVSSLNDHESPFLQSGRDVAVKESNHLVASLNGVDHLTDGRQNFGAQLFVGSEVDYRPEDFGDVPVAVQANFGNGQCSH
jgi:hypothetical protein